MIPKEKIEEVKDRTNIVQVISEYVPLKKRGINHTGLCPFHSEKTPSFTVSEQKQMFYCFGCNASGNVITFVMKKEGMEFVEAVKTLARRCGVAITDELKGVTEARELIHRALKESLEFFENELKGASGKVAREYLKKRGYDGEIASRFHLGYAPESWDSLANHLRKKGVALDCAEKAGLLGRKDSRFYDKFRARVIFPITDVRGRIIGFGGRCLDNSTPKYLNSPETMVFRKGETLFGLYQAKEEIMRQGYAIVVEGYFDLLSMHKNGFKACVATMGTALTPGHLRTLKGYAGTVYCLFDSDEAGKKAAIRGLELFLQEDMNCRAVILPGAKDPDEFLAKAGAEAMKEAISGAEPLMEFYLKELKKRFDTTAPEGKKQYFEEARRYLLMVKNVAEKGHYASFAASILGIEGASVMEALREKRGSLENSASIKGAAEAKKAASSLHELTVLRVILKHPELFDEKVEAAIEAFTAPELKKAGGIIAAYLKEGRVLDASSIIEEFKDDELKAMIAGFLFKDEEGFIEDPGRMLEDCLKRILNRGKLKETTRELIKTLEGAGKTDVAREIKQRMESGPGRK